MATSFSGEGSRREPPTTGKQLVNFITLFRNQPIRNKNCLWRTCLLMDWDEMSNLYRKPAIDDSYQVLLHLAEGLLQVNFFSHWLKVLHLENLLFFLNQDPPNRNNNSS
jgi:hypothetical protein